MTSRALRPGPLTSVCWNRADVPAAEREAAAMRVVSVLLGACASQAIWSTKPPQTRRRRETNQPSCRPASDSSLEALLADVGRPGSGGRIPVASPYTPTTATAELIERLGQPHRYSDDGVQLLAWHDADDGDGIVCARLSGRELQHGETAMGQIHPTLEFLERIGERPRLLVVTVNNSGARDYERRPDFRLIEQAVREGWCRWTAWSVLDRLVREPLPAELFYRFLRESETTLYLASLGRAVDWARDRVALRTFGVYSAEERESVFARTHGALKRRFLDEGRGWPGAKRFGFRRNPITKFLEVDPEQWPFVKMLHYGYADLAEPESVRTLRSRLAAAGCSLSVAQIVAILQDPIYATGEWSVNYRGESKPGRPVTLLDPIPAHLYQRNQELLALRRGRTRTRTPLGEFCLNGVPLEHARCRGETRDGVAARLRGRIDPRSRSRDYAHSPWVPARCRGYRIERELLEAAVIGAAAGVWRDEALQAAWRSADRRSRVPTTPIFDDEQRRQTARRVATLKRQLAQLERAYLDRLAQGEAAVVETFADLTGAVQAEIKQLQARLDQRTADPPQPPERQQESLRRALEETLALGAGDDTEQRQRRAALLQALIERICVEDSASGICVEITSLLEGDPSQERFALAGEPADEPAPPAGRRAQATSVPGAGRRLTARIDGHGCATRADAGAAAAATDAAFARRSQRRRTPHVATVAVGGKPRPSQHARQRLLGDHCGTT
jgi:hypothetical protein